MPADLVRYAVIAVCSVIVVLIAAAFIQDEWTDYSCRSRGGAIVKDAVGVHFCVASTALGRAARRCA